jgi:hypothetical protein
METSEQEFKLMCYSSGVGVERIADALGTTTETLYKKLNPNAERNVLNYREFKLGMAVCNSRKPLEALCQEFGGLFLPLDAYQKDASDVQMLDQITQLWLANGEFGREVHNSLADFVLTKDELDRCKARGYAIVREVMGTLSRLESMVTPG